jgi:hypothetical protein
MFYKAYKSKKAKTKPINPETSTKLKPMKDQRINVFAMTGFLEIDNNKKAKIIPTPIPTPANEINGILDAKYLNPNNIIEKLIKLENKYSSICVNSRTYLQQ